MAETRVLAHVPEFVEDAKGRRSWSVTRTSSRPSEPTALFPALCERLRAVNLEDTCRQRDLSERQALACSARANPRPTSHTRRGAGSCTSSKIPPAQAAPPRGLVTGCPARPRRERDARLPSIGRARVERGGADGARSCRSPWPGRARSGEARVPGRRPCPLPAQRPRARRPQRHPRHRRRRRPLGAHAPDRPRLTALAAPPLRGSRSGPCLRAYRPRCQGATVERAFVLLPDQGALRERGYVACSRARTETHVYLAELDAIERETPPPRTDPVKSTGVRSASSRALARRAARARPDDSPARRRRSSIRPAPGGARTTARPHCRSARRR